MIITMNIGDLFFFTKKKSINDDDLKESDSKEDSLLCRFVLDGTGKKIGESIAIYGDFIIIKSRDKYLGVPLKHIEENNKTLIVKGLVNQDKAKDFGEQWRKESFDEIKLKEEKSNGF